MPRGHAGDHTRPALVYGVASVSAWGMRMSKLDFKKAEKTLYSGRAGRFHVLDVPPQSFLMIDGAGDPNREPAFGRAVTALYALSYPIKFHSKNALGRDFAVAPLEGLWWADDMAAFRTRDTDRWRWTMMIRQPDWIDGDAVASVRATAAAKLARKTDEQTDEATLAQVRLETLHEGLCVQVLHVGPYDTEGPILQQMHEHVIPENGCRMTGKHHEIYLNDARKTPPEKLRTLLRQPMERV